MLSSMSDLAKSDIHGPVHTLRTECAEWDLSNENWHAPRFVTVVRFRPDGRMSEHEIHNPDSSISQSTYSYDDAGQLKEAESVTIGGSVSRATCSAYSYDDARRLIRVAFVDQDGTEHQSEAWGYDTNGKRTRVHSVPGLAANPSVIYAIEGTEHSYGVPGVTTIVTVFDDEGRPERVLFRDADERLLSTVTLERDGMGRLAKEEMSLDEYHPFHQLQNEGDAAAPPDRNAEALMLASFFGPRNVMSSTTYAYDQMGHLLERRTRMGELQEQRTMFRYDDRDNRIEEITEVIEREVQLDDEAHLQTAKERSSKHTVRFDYTYDGRGNWTGRLVRSRLESNPDFQRSNVVRREIVYYED